MASFNQNFVKFEDDTFALLYTFTDLVGTFTGAYEAWWGCSETYGGTSILEKATSTWVTGMPSTGINLANTTATISFTQADFAQSSGPLATNTTYYHELVVAPDGTEDTSIVVAVGTFQVDPSIFSADGYRP